MEKSRHSQNQNFVSRKLRNLFEAAQQQTGYQDLVNKCRKLYTKNGDEESFFSEFITILRYCLVYSEKVAVERMLSFAAKFAVSLYSLQSQQDESVEEEETDLGPFVAKLFEFLFESHKAALPEARMRCVQLLNKILCGMPQNSSISDETWMKLSDTVLCRIQDKSPQVRVQAVITAAKLQDPKNPRCEIIEALVFHLNDPTPAVRRTVVSIIALNKSTIGYVLARTRDVNDNVRRNTYVVFSKVRVLSLSIKFRILILERGLQDRSEMVRKCVENLVIIHWLENFNRDIVKLLEALDVVTCADTAKLLLDAIFRVLPLDDVMKSLPFDEDKRLIPEEKLSPESALLWRCLATFLSKEARDEELEAILPNLVTFCDYVARFYPHEKPSSLDMSSDEQWLELKERETLFHLMELAKVFDLGDEMGRISLKKLIVSLLTSSRSNSNMVECLVQLMVTVLPDKQHFLQELTEVISELREPLTTVVTEMNQQQKMDLDLQISDLKVDLNELQEREYTAIQEKNYALAQSIVEEIKVIKEKIEELATQPTRVSHEVAEQKTDPVTCCKCLSIVMNMINASQLQHLTPILLSIKDDLVDQCLRSQDLLTQSRALQTLAQYCILDLDLAKDTLLRLVLMLSETGEDDINIPALQAIYDIIQKYGVEVFDATADEPVSSMSTLGDLDGHDGGSSLSGRGSTNTALRCISALRELLNCKNDALKKMAFEGLCKLLASGVIYSSSLLSQIVIKGFSPIVESESEDFIRQVFIVFLPVFAANSPRSQEMLEAAFIPTMRTVINAALGTPEADINPRDVASFLIEYTRPGINRFTSKTIHVHNNLAIAICHEVLRDMTSLAELGITQCYLKSLLQLQLSLDTQAFQAQLDVLLKRIEEETTEKTCVRLVKDLRQRVNQKLQTTVQSIENTVDKSNLGQDTEDSTRLTRTGRCSGLHNSVAEESLRVRPGSSVRSSMRKSEVSVRLSTLNESAENVEISESSGSIGASRIRHGVVPESPDVSTDG